MTEFLACVGDRRGVRVWWLNTCRTSSGRLVFAAIECSWYIGPLDT